METNLNIKSFSEDANGGITSLEAVGMSMSSGPSVVLEDNKTTTISENGTVEITPSATYDAMKKVTAIVNVESSVTPPSWLNHGLDTVLAVCKRDDTESDWVVDTEIAPIVDIYYVPYETDISIAVDPNGPYTLSYSDVANSLNAGYYDVGDALTWNYTLEDYIRNVYYDSTSIYSGTYTNFKVLGYYNTTGYPLLMIYFEF